MSWLGPVATAAGRGAVRLVPAARRDWAEAVWAEAHEVPPGWPRLAWRAGGVLLIAREGQMARRIGILLLFAAAAGAAAWGAWPGSPVSHGAAVQGGIIITLTLLAGLPLLTRWRLGPPDSRPARWLRAGFYAAILATLPTRAAIGLFVGAVPRAGIDRHTWDVVQGYGVPGSSSGGPDWAGEIAILILTACYVAVILALTARRTPVAPATLAIAVGAGLVLGVVMYAVAPLGLNLKYPYRPWLHGSAAEAFGVLAWVLVFGAPLIAGAIAGRRCYVPDDPGQAGVARAWQGFAAGLVSGGVGALFITLFGSGTVSLLVESAWVRDWLNHGQHLTASAVYGRELYASQNVTGYFVLLVGFPIIGVMMGLVGSGVANVTGTLPDSSGPPGPPGGGGPEPVPAPPDGGRQADAGVDAGVLTAVPNPGPVGLPEPGRGVLAGVGAHAGPAPVPAHH
jgi:hypothetical protein